ncbi:ABC transporter, permease protein [Corynebacterium amycolatum SK46]|nr:ABC transporter, permease protein [Corynebacterium amycolatum SK46]
MTTSTQTINVATPPVAPDTSANENSGSHEVPPRRTPSRKRSSHFLKSSRLKLRTLQLSVFAAFLAIWWAIARFSGIDPVILPSPGSVFTELIDGNRCVPTTPPSGSRDCGVQGYFLWQHLLATLERIAVGLSLGIAAGVLVGLVLSRSQAVRAVVEPYISFLRSLPPLGYIGLLIVWFGVGDVSKVVLLFLATFPIITIATLTGIIGIPQDWNRAARTLGATNSQVFRHVIVPGTLPGLINGIRLANGMSWACIVAAEMNDGIPGIGGVAYVSGTQLETALTIAAMILIGITAVIVDQILLFAERRLAPWHGKQ